MRVLKGTLLCVVVGWYVGNDAVQASPRGPELAFKVHVRAIGAEGEIPLADEPKAAAISVDPRIGDLKPKLSKLPFTSFRLVASQEETLVMRRRDKIRLMNGQLLTLRPLEFDNESLTLWIRWDDGEGMNILDTRIHFAYGESMLAGLEGRDESGMILAIDVSPSSD